MTVKRYKALKLLVLTVLAPFDSVQADNVLPMFFRDKPPYSYIANGEMKGFLLERTRKIADRAGVRIQFQEMPPKRIFQEIQHSGKPACSFGWYKIPERENFALFSKPIHQDRPHIILASSNSAGSVKAHQSLADLMTDGKMAVSVADGVSYGPELDALIKAFPGKVDRGGVAPLTVAQKVASGRADFMFIDQEDYDYLMEMHPEFHNEKLVRLEFSDLPPGLKRYILCSRQTGDALIGRINSAIDIIRPVK